MPDGFAFDMNVPVAGVTGAEFVQASFAQFGIELNIIVRPAPDFYIEFFEERASSFLSGMSVRADRWQQLAFLGRAEGPYDFILPPADKDAEVQAAFKKVTEIFDPEPRAEAFRELNRVMVSRAWHIHLNYNSSVYAHDPDLGVRTLRRRQAPLRTEGRGLGQLGILCETLGSPLPPLRGEMSPSDRGAVRRQRPDKPRNPLNNWCRRLSGDPPFSLRQLPPQRGETGIGVVQSIPSDEEPPSAFGISPARGGEEEWCIGLWSGESRSQVVRLAQRPRFRVSSLRTNVRVAREAP